MMKNAYSLVQVGVDTAEKETSEILKFGLSSDNRQRAFIGSLWH